MNTPSSPQARQDGILSAFVISLVGFLIFMPLCLISWAITRRLRAEAQQDPVHNPDAGDSPRSLLWWAWQISIIGSVITLIFLVVFATLGIVLLVS